MPPQVPHGGGVRGRDGCDCELCREARKTYIRNYMRTFRAKARGDGKAERTAEDVRVRHGGGAKGRKDCDCEPCKTRRRQYIREGAQRRRRVERGEK
jgi:hypothetical protein